MTDLQAEADHKAKMQRIKAARDRMMAEKTDARGLLIVHTGKGKGKSSAAWGMVMRCLGHGMRVGIVQFIKGAWNTGEAVFLQRFPELVTIRTMGEGFTWETQDRAPVLAAAERAWVVARRMLVDPAIRLVVLDELNVVLRYDYLSIQAVLEAVAARPQGQLVVITGRYAPEALIEAADLVTEKTLVKHTFRAGIKAQPGIEY